MSTTNTRKLAAKLIDLYLKQDFELFGRSYTANQYRNVKASEPKIDIEHLKADISEMGVTSQTSEVLNPQFSMLNQPLTYVITVQVKNILNSGCSEMLVTRHIANLECTYGETTVRETIQLIFPNFYQRYYGQA